MIIEQLIDEFITKYVFPQFREVSHPMYAGRYFTIGLTDWNPVAMISPFDNTLAVSPSTWSFVQCMFSLTEDETIVVLKRWLNMYIPLLRFNGITLLRYA
jgi:hypothetical protein